jgi:hypothetical protein
MTVNAQRLEGLTSAEFGKAERLFQYSSRVQLGIAIAAGLSIFVTDEMPTLAASILVLVLYLAWAALDWCYRDSRAQAERGRRALMIVDGLGDKVSSGELREVEACFTVTREKGAAAQNPEFFASRKAPGEPRLTEMLEESGFYSCRLYHFSAGWAWRRLTVSFVISIALLLSAIMMADTSQLVTSARLLCTVITFLVSNEVLGAGRAYLRAHQALDGLQARVRSLRQCGYPRGDLLILLADYNSAVESAPMMAPGMYKKHRERLDELWGQHIEEE